MPHFSKAEIAGWFIAIAVVVGMGATALTGPFNNINKASAGPPPVGATVKIVNATGSQAFKIALYQPATITVKAGQSVIFTNDSKYTHTVTDRNNAFDSKDINEGSSWTYTATKPGTYHFYCIYHQYMLGTLIVSS